MIKIVADNKIPFLKGSMESYAHIEYLPGNKIKKKHLLTADGLIVRSRTRCDAELLLGTNVKFIASATIGFDHIDTGFCKKNEIFWTSSEGCNASSVNQYVVSALIYLAKKFKLNLGEMTMGIIGVGHVGTKIETLAKTLGMNVLLNDPPRARKGKHTEFVHITDILKHADIISLHVPLTYEGNDPTYHLVDEKFLQALSKKVYFINTSRGEVVDTLSLINAIETGCVKGAIIDVWENEPDLNTDLLDIVDIATPHIAGYSLDGKANGTAICVRAASKFFGWDINNWYPENIPLPTSPVINIDCSGESLEKIVQCCTFATYNIIYDDKRLRLSPDNFEQQRENYPVRREPSAFHVRLSSCDDEVVMVLKELGFSQLTVDSGVRRRPPLAD